MKKTLTANIGGLVFHLEEDAYAALNDYLDRVRRRFAGTAGSDEIMADIEARIAELFAERQSGRREVVTLADVEEVMRVMGRPDEFGEAEAPPAEEQGPRPGTGKAERRLYRDMEDHWVAGVLSGLAAYIGTEVLWMRVAFVVLVAVGWGAPVLFYFIMWMLVPVARTGAERLRMRGEPVNADNLKRMFEEGAERVKTGAERMAEEARDLGNRYGPAARDWSREAAGTAERTARGAAGVFVRVIGLLLLMAGAGLAIALFGGTVGALGFTWYGGHDHHGMDLMDLASVFLPSAELAWWVLAAAFVLLAVPIVMLMLAGFRVAFGLRAPLWVAAVAGTLWFIAFGALVVLGLRTGSDFTEEARQEMTTALPSPPSGVLQLGTVEGDSVQRTAWGYRRFSTHWSDSEGMYRQGDSLHLSFTWLEVEQSPDSLYHLVVVREARGRHGKLAADRCARIRSAWRQQGDSLLVGKWSSVPVADKFRAQRVRYRVLVPLGGAVRFLSSSASVIHDIPNTTNTLDADMIGRTWTMTPEGLAQQGGGATVEATPVKRAGGHLQAAIPFRGLPRRSAEEPVLHEAHLPDLSGLIGLLGGLVR
ncbi:MAG: PspC domain-containing protein [Flavobacteriales bacterium]|nr:PspC domain-containing protein [Flavobacteriales bacterium]